MTTLKEDIALLREALKRLDCVLPNNFDEQFYALDRIEAALAYTHKLELIIANTECEEVTNSTNPSADRQAALDELLEIVCFRQTDRDRGIELLTQLRAALSEPAPVKVIPGLEEAIRLCSGRNASFIMGGEAHTKVIEAASAQLELQKKAEG